MRVAVLSIGKEDVDETDVAVTSKQETRKVINNPAIVGTIIGIVALMLAVFVLSLFVLVRNGRIHLITGTKLITSSHHTACNQSTLSKWEISGP